MSENTSLTENIACRLNLFCNENRFVDLYRSYNWGNDSWETGFVDILRIERQLSSHLSTGGVSLDDVKEIAKWGKLRNPGRIKGASVVLPTKTIYGNDGTLDSRVDINSLDPLLVLRGHVESGIGPTYLTKSLRFAIPTIYGAIDTRCVRVFGIGDPASKKHNWLDLKVKNYGYGWFIPEKQKQWPAGYALWLGILKTICSLQAEACPHPSAFVEYGLRKQGVWTCADVEMALFTYASKYVGIDHGFSFHMQYFETHHLPPDWPSFLDDFQHHWPTDEDGTYVDFVRDGLVGNGAARMGDSHWC